MGIRGSVKRGLDGHFIHANCDPDIIVGDEPPMGSTAKPEELYQIIERFCNGRRWAGDATHYLTCNPPRTRNPPRTCDSCRPPWNCCPS